MATRIGFDKFLFVSEIASATGRIPPTASLCYSSAANVNWVDRIREVWIMLRIGLRLQIGLLSILACCDAAATGFFVPQQSVPNVGRAQAGGSAIANDPSTIFFNPAGLSRLWDEKPPMYDEKIKSDDAFRASAGVNVIFPSIDFTNTGTTATTPATLGTPVPVGGGNGGNPGSPSPVLNFYGGYQANKDFYVGLGINMPFGLGAEYDSDWFGRYDSIKSELITINVSPVMSYKINNWLSFGAGIDFQYADAELTNALPNTLLPGGPTAATDGLFELEGSDWAVGYNVGLLIEPAHGTRIGLHYRSAITHKLEGTATTSGLTGPLAAANGTVGATSELNLPDIVSLGVAQEITRDFWLMGEFMWFGWSDFDEIRVQFDNGSPDAVRVTNYRNTYAISLGAEYRVHPKWIVRGGLSYDRTPTQDGYRDTSIPDGDRLWVALGTTWRACDWMTLDFALAHVFFEDGDVDLTRSFYTGTAAAGTVDINGVSETSTTTVGINARFRF